ncbi:hypothetical protein GALL_537850 [mine drainage metagenome]|uniref:Uncharacterized protein n=1 Tax=mine drainage metagenome TaxID=410659 RepID=A0A1J5P0P8_9ZZZZ
MDAGQDLAALAGQARPHGLEPGVGDDLAAQGLAADSQGDMGLAQTVLRLSEMNQRGDRRAGVLGGADQGRLGRQRGGARRLLVEGTRSAPENEVAADAFRYGRKGPGLHAGAAGQALEIFYYASRRSQLRREPRKSLCDIDFHDATELSADSDLTICRTKSRLVNRQF